MDLVIVFISFFIDARFSFFGSEPYFSTLLIDGIEILFTFFFMTGKAIFETFPRDMGFVLYCMICGVYLDFDVDLI